ncbi:MAG: hypothetical protein V1822_01075 [Candidatus Micrarchaeota archaeon]
MKGQLSAEMLIVLAIILGLALLVFVQMTKSTKDVSKAVDEKTQMVVDQTQLKPEDVYCSDDSQCERARFNNGCNIAAGHCN